MAVFDEWQPGRARKHLAAAIFLDDKIGHRRVRSIAKTPENDFRTYLAKRTDTIPCTLNSVPELFGRVPSFWRLTWTKIYL